MEICAVVDKGSSAGHFLASNTEYTGYTVISWIMLPTIVLCGLMYIYAALEIKRTHHNQFNFETGVMCIGFALNLLLIMDYFVYCSDVFVLISQAV
jgi:hypothetical protein